MDQVSNILALASTSLYGLVALGLFAVSVYWMFNKKAMQRQMAELRARLDEMQPEHSGNLKAQALATSLVIDAQTRQFLSHDGGGNADHYDGGSMGSHSYQDGHV